MTANGTVLLAIAVLLAGAPLALAASRSRTAAGWIAFLATAASSALALVAAGKTLLGIRLFGEPVEAWTVFAIPSLGSSLRIQVDGLSAVFLILIAAIALL